MDPAKLINRGTVDDTFFNRCVFGIEKRYEILKQDEEDQNLDMSYWFPHNEHEML